jgi:hypothetical protein
MTRFAYVLALFWGLLWAALLQWTQFGRWLAIRRTWITVVVGVGIDLLLALPLLPWLYWRRLLVIIALSSLGIIARSLLNELSEERDVIRAARGR